MYAFSESSLKDWGLHHALHIRLSTTTLSAVGSALQWHCQMFVTPSAFATHPGTASALVLRPYRGSWLFSFSFRPQDSELPLFWSYSSWWRWSHARFSALPKWLWTHARFIALPRWLWTHARFIALPRWPGPDWSSAPVCLHPTKLFQCICPVNCIIYQAFPVHQRVSNFTTSATSQPSTWRSQTQVYHLGPFSYIHMY